jgi:single-stranded-DNA-specific exonuclease
MNSSSQTDGGSFFTHWQARSTLKPANTQATIDVLRSIRGFNDHSFKLAYGDHGLERVRQKIVEAIRQNKRIALYADYDVDGTMSAVSWIWFFKEIGFSNYLHYIPCRFSEGYGLNLKAVQNLIHNQKAQLIITMDTGITANNEAAYCKEHGVDFVCTDHHVIQAEKMPDCLVLNPKQHPDPAYQELCGCGITFVLLRQMASDFKINPQAWSDILALAGMATICDMVPLNPVNHQIARLGVKALRASNRPVLKRLLQGASAADEKDVGFRLGPRINAVGRLEHADAVIKAFVEENPDELIRFMNVCNEQRRLIQQRIESDALAMVGSSDDLIISLGSKDWHAGVVGIAASRLSQQFWRPTWLFVEQDGIAKGSARSIPGLNITELMQGLPFLKMGGHAAAAGFSFELSEKENIVSALREKAQALYTQNPSLWQSRMDYDCELSLEQMNLELCEALDELKPFGMGFEEPRFRMKARVISTKHYLDKQTGAKKHTALQLEGSRKLTFFNRVLDIAPGSTIDALVQVSENQWMGKKSAELYGLDISERKHA